MRYRVDLLNHFNNSFLGFDRLFSELDSLANKELTSTYPPHNIIKDGNTWYIELAVAGLSKEDLDIKISKNNLIISYEKSEQPESRDIMFRGIANRNFTKVFRLSEDVEIKGATMNNGMLVIELRTNEQRDIERKITIN